MGARPQPGCIVFSVSDAHHEQQVRDHLRSTFPEVAAVAEDRLVAVPAADLFPGALGNVTAVEAIVRELHTDRSQRRPVTPRCGGHGPGGEGP